MKTLNPGGKDLWDHIKATYSLQYGLIFFRRLGTNYWPENKELF